MPSFLIPRCLLWVLAGGFWFSSFVIAAPKPMPTDPDILKDIRYYYHKPVDPSSEVPVYAEYYRWRIQGKIGGVELYPAEVPVVVYDTSSMRLRQVATVPVGQEIELNQVQSFKGIIYYGFPLEVSQNGSKVGWVSGHFIERVDSP